MSVELQFQLARKTFRLDAALRMPAAGFTALFGPSGCGKTTLLHCLAGLERADGYCRVGGQIWQDRTRFLAPSRRGVGMVFQDARLFPHLSVAGNLRYAARRGGALGELAEMAELLGLGALLDRAPGTLSGGERQRVAIARALLSRPRLLLLDEPLVALDAGSKAEILTYLERVQRRLEVPALYVTHSLDEVIRLADHLVLMEAGRTIAQGRLKETLARLDPPLPSAEDAGAMLEATLAGAEHDWHLSILTLGTQQLRIPLQAARAGTRLRLHIRARDVSLALERPREASILNVLRARILALGEPDAGTQMVRLDLDGQPLLARLSALSCARLQLHPGLEVYAQIKGVALA